ncbi:MAG: hypothetical protein QNJ45_18605 [Ardenticatenaceae bacterium]|nr:hypothetical protein [Ardenticatenaceae bacterium]
MTKNRFLQFTVLGMAIFQSLTAGLMGSGFAELLTLGAAANSVGEISDLYPNQFVPAGYTFAIWGPIYFGLLFFAIYQVRKVKADDPVIAPLRVPIALAFFGNAIWIPFNVTDQQLATVIIIVGMLVALAVTFVRLQPHITRLSAAEYGFIALPLVMFFSWITVATVANITTFLVSIGWNGFGLAESIWAAIMITAAATIVLGILVYSRGNIVYGGVAIWALIGIAIGNPGTPAVTASVLAAVIAGALIWLNVQKRSQDVISVAGG